MIAKTEQIAISKELGELIGRDIKKMVIIHDDRPKERQAMLEIVMKNQMEDTAILILPKRINQYED